MNRRAKRRPQRVKEKGVVKRGTQADVTAKIQAGQKRKSFGTVFHTDVTYWTIDSP